MDQHTPSIISNLVGRYYSLGCTLPSHDMGKEEASCLYPFRKKIDTDMLRVNISD